MNETAINNHLALVGTYALSGGFLPKRYFGELFLRGAYLVFVSYDNTELFKFEIATLNFQKVDGDTAISLGDDTSFFKIFFANGIHEYSPVTAGSQILQIILDAIGSRSPQLSFTDEKASVNKEFVQFLYDALEECQKTVPTQ